MTNKTTNSRRSQSSRIITLIVSAALALGACVSDTQRSDDDDDDDDDNNSSSDNNSSDNNSNNDPVQSGEKTCGSDNECGGLDCEHIDGVEVGACVEPCSEGSCPGGTTCVVGPTIGLASSCFQTCTGAEGQCAAGFDCAEYDAGSWACFPSDWLGPPAPAQTGIGDACYQESDCDVGSCNGAWCQQSCQYSSDCDGTGPGGDNNTSEWSNWCIPASSGTDQCFPGCFNDADCAGYPGTTCQQANTTLGVEVYVCST